MGECRYSSTFLDLGTRWKLVVSPCRFTPGAHWICVWVDPIVRRYGEKNLALPGIEPGPSVTIPTELSGLLLNLCTWCNFNIRWIEWTILAVFMLLRYVKC
jgi:hypothetical protein